MEGLDESFQTVIFSKGPMAIKYNRFINEWTDAIKAGQDKKGKPDADTPSLQPIIDPNA